jgi:cytochrome c peroxidase
MASLRCYSTRTVIGFLVALLCGLAAFGQAAGPGVSEPAAAFAHEPIMPVPVPVNFNTPKVRLGERLFADTILSHSRRVACVSCHQLEKAGVDHNALTVSIESGAPLDFNTATIFNSALSFRQGWIGRFRKLEEQNEAVILNPALMNTTWDELLGKLRADPSYSAAFADAYGSPVARAAVLDALASYERTLLTSNARFDRYLLGDSRAITPEEEQGYRLFKALGCVACHQGVNVGGNLFQRFGIFEPPYPAERTVRPVDLGRFTATGQDRDRYVFRVPGLRNVAVTAPYFHDGSVPTLERAVAAMARKQLGRTLSVSEIDLLVSFLGTLTGEYRGRPLDQPAEEPRP